MLARHILASLLALGATAGCQTYGPHSYGQNNYNGYYGGPAYSSPGMMQPYGAPTTMSPGLPPGATYSPAPAYGMSPGPGFNSQPGFNNQPGFNPTPNFNPTYTPLGGQINGNVGNAQPFPNAGPSASARPQMPGDEKLVPNYQDPGSPLSPRTPVRTPEMSDPAGFKEGFNAPQNSKNALKAMEEDQAAVTPRTAPRTGVATNGTLEPMAYTVPVMAHGTQKVAENTGRPMPNPYARAKDQQSWFRGLVDFDAQDQAWFVVYDAEAPETDPLGGSITLAHDPRLDGLRPDDVVLIEGEFDVSEVDRGGNPKYRLTNIERLVPQEIDASELEGAVLQEVVTPATGARKTGAFKSVVEYRR